MIEEPNDKIGYIINIESEVEEGSGIITLSKNKHNFVELNISQSHLYGMSAEVLLNKTELTILLGAIERAQKIISEGISHNERFTIETISLTDTLPMRQGMVMVSLFKEFIILVVSLTNGGDPDIKINKNQSLEVVNLFSKALINMD